MADAIEAIWCETCGRMAPLDEWQRKLSHTRVVAAVEVVGYVSTYEHRPCRVFTAAPVAGREPLKRFLN